MDQELAVTLFFLSSAIIGYTWAVAWMLWFEERDAYDEEDDPSD